VKKKILTVSILLGITAIALVGYFIGCQQRQAATSLEDGTEETQQPVVLDTAMKPPALPGESKRPVSELQVTEKSLTKLSQLQKEVPRDEIRFQKQLEVAREAGKQTDAFLIHNGEAATATKPDVSDVSGIPHVTFQDSAVITNVKGKSQREIYTDLESKSEKSAEHYFVNGQVPVLGDKPEMGGMGGYGRTDVRGSRSGGMRGYGGGMGGRYRTNGPAPTFKPESAGATTTAPSRPSDSRRAWGGSRRVPDTRRIPVELLNVT